MAAPSLLRTILCSLACFCSLRLAHGRMPQDVAGLNGSCPDLLTLSSLRSAPPDSGGGELLLAVPWKLGSEKFVNFSPASCNITGFSIDVFRSALPHLQDPRLQSFRLVLVGDGAQPPSYDEMIDMLRDKRLDGLVGDFIITRDRLKKVGFTLPYLATYLVMISLSRFTSLCIFQSQQESVRTQLGRIVTGTWLFTMLVFFNSGYTASLSSLLSSQKRYSTIGGFQALLRDTNITVGCQEGSFMENYMRKLNLMDHKIKKFNSLQQFVEALKKGNDNETGVGAVLEEAPYVRELVQSDCDLIQSSRNDDYLPSFGGLGFAFRREDALIEQMSKIILQMASNGTLKKLQKDWQINVNPTDISCPSSGSSHLGLKSFEGLFFVVSAVYLGCVTWHFWKTKAIKSPKQSCALIHTSSCAQDESTIDRQAGELPLIRGERKSSHI